MLESHCESALYQDLFDIMGRLQYLYFGSGSGARMIGNILGQDGAIWLNFEILKCCHQIQKTKTECTVGMALNLIFLFIFLK